MGLSFAFGPTTPFLLLNKNDIHLSLLYHIYDCGSLLYHIYVLVF
jgi:hypothetical protein